MSKVNESLGQLVRPYEQMESMQKDLLEQQKLNKWRIENMEKMILEQQKQMLDKIDRMYDDLDTMKQNLQFDRLSDMIEKLQEDMDILKQELQV
mgnify:CR=1 FL=1